MLKENDKAPDFELAADTGAPVKLSDFKGQRVILFFYPKAMTSGCTKQVQGLRDDFARYETAEAILIGVSPDSVKRQAKFKEKEGLPFILLADEEHEAAEKYGVWVEKKMYGKTFWGNERTTFIIGPDGTIEKIFRRVKPAAHSQELLATLADLDEKSRD